VRKLSGADVSAFLNCENETDRKIISEPQIAPE
jgi:hypothetical protein